MSMALGPLANVGQTQLRRCTRDREAGWQLKFSNRAGLLVNNYAG